MNEVLVRKICLDFYAKHDVFLNVDYCDKYPMLYIEPRTSKGDCKFAGMQIWFHFNDNIFEVSEYMAGENENELHIFYESKSLKRALNNLLIGNKRPQSKILRKYS